MDRIPFQATAAGAPYDSIRTLPVAVLLDNVRSLYNVGAFFRTADAAAIEKLYLCGITGRPPKRAITKTALGAEETVPGSTAWEPVPMVAGDPRARIRNRGDRDHRPRRGSVRLDAALSGLRRFRPRSGRASGRKSRRCAIRTCASRCSATKHSLNVATAGGVVIYELLRKYRALGLALR